MGDRRDRSGIERARNILALINGQRGRKETKGEIEPVSEVD